LFDAEFYSIVCPSAPPASANLLDHYLLFGVRNGYSPNPLFHGHFYARRHFPASKPDINPLYHYISEGAAKDCQPHPLFDPLFYKKLCDSSGYATPLEHYLHSPASSRLSPHPLFDAEYYLNKLESQPAIALLAHYVCSWRRDRRSPHPLFDIDYYLARYPEAANSEYDPISHYLEIGADLGYSPHPLFNTEHYYRLNPDVSQAGLNGLLHYLQYGGFEGRDPHPWFDSSYYLEHNPDVAAAGINPLLHYVILGESEERPPHPLFRAADWRSANPDVERGRSPLVEFATQIETSGEHPFALLGFRNRQNRSPAARGTPGVNIIGWPRLEIGFGEYVRQIARAFATASDDFGVRDVSLMRPEDPGDDSIIERIYPDCRFKTNLFVLNADNMLFTSERLGFEEIRHRFNVAMWAWELAEYPDVWRKEMRVIDEFWAGSAFNQQCLAMKTEVPVLHMPQPVTISDADGSWGRLDFGIPEHRFLFLFQFDFTAFIERKNPYACLAAFRRAFPTYTPAGPVLVIKTNNSERYLEEMRKLKDAVGDDPNIVIVSGTFRRGKVMAIMNACDVFVSLHRSEGFGRSLAEAMLMGKPVIGTNYSGNTEFMRPDNSCLVNYSLVSVPEGHYPHATGQVWAEADIDHAAWHMRRLLAHRVLREQISKVASATIAENYNLEVTGHRYIRRLRLLGLMG
jgi:glycosyltransferase involved in cell wall biosynthesis